MLSMNCSACLLLELSSCLDHFSREVKDLALTSAFKCIYIKGTVFEERLTTVACPLGTGCTESMIFVVLYSCSCFVNPKFKSKLKH